MREGDVNHEKDWWSPDTWKVMSSPCIMLHNIKKMNHNAHKDHTGVNAAVFTVVLDVDVTSASPTRPSADEHTAK